MKLQMFLGAAVLTTAFSATTAMATCYYNCDSDNAFQAGANFSVGGIIGGGVNDGVKWSAISVEDNKFGDTYAYADEHSADAGAEGGADYIGTLRVKDPKGIGFGLGADFGLVGDATVTRDGHQVGYEIISATSGGDVNGIGQVLEGHGQVMGDAYTVGAQNGSVGVKSPGPDSDDGFGVNYSGGTLNGYSHAGDGGSAAVSNSLKVSSYAAVNTNEDQATGH